MTQADEYFDPMADTNQSTREEVADGDFFGISGDIYTPVNPYD